MRQLGRKSDAVLTVLRYRSFWDPLHTPHWRTSFRVPIDPTLREALPRSDMEISRFGCRFSGRRIAHTWQWVQ